MVVWWCFEWLFEALWLFSAGFCGCLVNFFGQTNLVFVDVFVGDEGLICYFGVFGGDFYPSVVYYNILIEVISLTL